MTRRTDAPIIWIDQFCINSWAHLKVWCRPGAPCNQHPRGKASSCLKSSCWMPTVPRMPLLWGRSVPARPAHPVTSIPEGPGVGWTLLPAQVEHQCLTKETLILLNALLHCPKPGRTWALGRHKGWECFLCGCCELGKACLRYWAVTVLAVALQCCGCSAVAAQSGWTGEVCAAGSQAYSSGNTICICEELLFCLFRFLAEVFWRVANISFNSAEILLMFCFGTR